LALTRHWHEAMNRGAGHRKSSNAPSLGHLVLFCFVTCFFLLYSVETEEMGILRGPFRSNFVLSIRDDTTSCCCSCCWPRNNTPFHAEGREITFVATDASVLCEYVVHIRRRVKNYPHYSYMFCSWLYCLLTLR